MNRSDVAIAATLAVLALFIWLRDTTWASSSDDTLPILVGLPLFYWIGRPWELTRPLDHIPGSLVGITAVLLLLGILANSTLLLAVGWTYLLYGWLSKRTAPKTHSKLRKLLILPLMSFPWITLDAQTLGWYFRLSGAYVNGEFFSLLGLDVHVEGTNLIINGLPISVEAACAGLNTLQSMLIAGSLVAFIYLGESSRYWWNLPLLVLIAWLANTVRIGVISSAALVFGPAVALGAFHTLGGWLVVVLMFLVCWLIFWLQEPKQAKA